MNKKKDIRQLTLEQLTLELLALEEKPFRAKQIYEWLWKKRATSFDEMTSLSIDLREKLKKDYEIRAIQLSEAQYSNDRTVKNAFELALLSFRATDPAEVIFPSISILSLITILILLSDFP